MSIDEYEQSIAWMVDQAASRLLIIHHAVFNNLDENLDAATWSPNSPSPNRPFRNTSAYSAKQA